MTEDELKRLVRRMRRLAMLIRALTVFGYIAFGFLLGVLWCTYRLGRLP
jgi:hypothetical protein